jgi:hypothetical protein
MFKALYTLVGSSLLVTSRTREKKLINENADVPLLALPMSEYAALLAILGTGRDEFAGRDARDDEVFELRSRRYEYHRRYSSASTRNITISCAMECGWGNTRPRDESHRAKLPPLLFQRTYMDVEPYPTILLLYYTLLVREARSRSKMFARTSTPSISSRVSSFTFTRTPALYLCYSIKQNCAAPRIAATSDKVHVRCCFTRRPCHPLPYGIRRRLSVICPILYNMLYIMFRMECMRASFVP